MNLRWIWIALSESAVVAATLGGLLLIRQNSGSSAARFSDEMTPGG